MNTFTVALVLVCCLLHQYVEAQDEECKEEMKIWKQKVNEIIDSGEPECVVNFDLQRFKCTGGEDPEKDKEVQEEFIKWIEEQDKETKEKVMGCMTEIASLSFKGTEVSDECKDKMQKALEDMVKELSGGESE